jgi:nitrous oxidase accessory protein
MTATMVARSCTRLDPHRAMRIRRLVATLLVSAASVAIALSPHGARSQGTRHIVSPHGTISSIAAALGVAQSGDVIEVRGGRYPSVVIDKSVTLEGIDGAVIDGGGNDVVVTITAPDVTLRGFIVRGSGSQPERDHSGIIAFAPRATIENNQLTDVLFGVFLSTAPGSVVRNNNITSMPQFSEARKGDAIRLWQSADSLIESNHVHGARDVVVWYSKNVVLRGNVIENGRYGVHLMYCDGALIERNVVRNNSVGVYTMYSNHITLRGNEIRGQWGPSGYALGFKDTDFVDTYENVLVDNRGGIFIDGMPFSTVGFSRIERNIVAFNDVGVVMMPAVRGNVLHNNTFWENVEQVAFLGGSASGKNEWHGNFWSDYEGFDRDGDGVGDRPYLSERGFESLLDREGLLRAFIYSPAVQAIEFASRAMPLVRPQPKLSDSAPSMTPLPIPELTGGRRPSPGVIDASMAASGVALLAAALSAVLLAEFVGRGGTRQPRTEESLMKMHARSSGADDVTIHVSTVSKRYGSFTALDGVSFDAHPGEAIALWGANGAGKSTLIKAILGLITYNGQIVVAGRDVRRSGKAARRAIGYVPQEIAFHDMSTRATLRFYAQLKQVSFARADELLNTLGLVDHGAKPVSVLSGGLRQRLALATALLADPPVLLLDEPTANLDAAAQREYLALLSRLCREQGKTIVFASHRLEEVEALAQHVLYLEHGRLIDHLPPHALVERLLPQAQLTLWVGGGEGGRVKALARLTEAGWPAHLNGRGTVVVQVSSRDKMKPIRTLDEHGIELINFEIDRGQLWT